MATTNIVHLIARELGLALNPLRDAIASSESFEAFMLELGWTVADIPTPILDLASATDRLNAALVPVLSEDASPSDFVELLEAMRDLRDGIDGLRGATFDVRLAAAGFAEKFPGELIEYLVVSYLMNERPRVAFLLSALGVIRSSYVDAASLDHHDYVRRELAWADFPKLVRDPIQLLENAFGWRTDRLAHEILLRAAANLALSAGLQAFLEEIDGKVVQVLEDQELDPGIPTRLGVNLVLFQRMAASGELAAGLKLLGLRGHGSVLPGFALLPYVTGEFGEDFEVDSRLTLSITSTLDLAGGLGVILRPATGLEILGNLTDPDTSTLADGRLILKVVNRDRSSDPTVLIGSQDGSRVEYKALSATAGVVLEAEGTPDLFAELRLEEARLVVKSGNADGFLQKILPADGIDQKFELAVGFSRNSGLYFRGSDSLQLAIPVHRELGPLKVNQVLLQLRAEREQFIAEAAVSVGIKLGPLQVVADGIGLRLNAAFPEDGGGNLGPLDLAVGFKPPTALGLSIDGGGFKGGGFLDFEPEEERYSGMLELEFQDRFTLKAFGLLNTRLPNGQKGFSLLIIISSEFTPIQLGLGFKLSGVGGLLGLNRTVNIEPLRTGLRENRLSSILFPTNIVANADRIISDLRQVFPPQEGRFIFGPMAKIEWGTPTLVTVELGLVIEVPEPVRLLILGVLRAVLPDERAAILRVQVNFLGEINFERRQLSFDASLFDSKLLGFSLSGDMAIRLDWGADANFLLTVGGFHPAYQPPPMNLPAIRRLTLALLEGDNPRLKLEMYFAVTSNTAQFGAKLELYAAAWKFNVYGFLTFDVLFQFNPFYFTAEITAMLALRVGSSSIASIKLTLTLEGPTPWKAQGTARFKICWFFTLKVRFNKTFGETRNTTLPDVAVLPLLAAALRANDNWEAELPRQRHRLESVREAPEAGTELLVHPVGTLKISQKVVPLRVRIDRIGSQRPSDGREFEISDVVPAVNAVKVEEMFAPAQFFDLTDEEKLTSASFKSFESGIRIGDAERLQTGYAAAREVSYELKYIDSQRDRRLVGLRDLFEVDVVSFNSWTLQGAIASSELSFARNRKSSLAPEAVAVSQERFAIVNTGDLKLFDELSVLGNERAAAARLDALIETNPSLRGSLQIVPAFELAA